MGNAILLAVVSHRVDLILHQGNQRRYDNGRALHHDGGQLVAQRFSPTSRHEHKGVMFLEQVLDDCFLVSLKLVEPEVGFQFINQSSFVSHNC